jgi:hypothetical protein
LNTMLHYRSPKDPPPPRRSKRKSDVDDVPRTPAKKRTKPAQPEQAESSEKEPSCSWTNLASALEGPSVAIAPPSSHDSPQGTPTADNNKLKKKKEPRNVGGWISPPFAAEVDRSWLEREKPIKDFDFSTYVPQVGDTVL